MNFGVTASDAKEVGFIKTGCEGEEGSSRTGCADEESALVTRAAAAPAAAVVQVAPPAAWPWAGAVEVRGLVLGYRDGPDVIRGLSFSARPGEKVMMVMVMVMIVMVMIGMIWMVLLMLIF